MRDVPNRADSRDVFQLTRQTLLDKCSGLQAR
jgi:hypothetical protein